MLMIAAVVILVIVLAGLIIRSHFAPADKAAMEIITAVVQKVEPLMKESNLAYWNATTTGEKKYYDEYEAKEIEYRKILSDKDVFNKLKKLKNKRYKDSLVKRQVNVLYLDFLANQMPEEMMKELVKKETELTEKFTTHRAEVDGRKITDNEIRSILKKSLNLGERQRIWEASKQVGGVIAGDLIQLVKLRNKAAGLLGFKNYYDMKLYLQDFTEEELYKILDELADFTDEPFERLKNEIDDYLAKKYGISRDDLRPWHYEDMFFQEAPMIYDIDFDKYFKDKDIVVVMQKYYDSIGLNVDDIIKRSDLYERNGKEQHAYCTDIDRKGDIRILANVKDNEYWAGTMLHELGHAVYDKYQSQEMPFLLREPAHIFTTEGIAELFGRLVYYPEWISAAIDPADKEGLKSEGEKFSKLLRAQMLIFARWVLVMVNFEKELYKNPEQNLNALWWNMVERFQRVHGPYGRNEPDWAAKIHFSTAPVYYHNYILGEIFASQLTNYIKTNLVSNGFPFIGNQKIGLYMKEKIFEPGARMEWNDLVKHATGEYLTPKYFAGQFAN